MLNHISWTTYLVSILSLSLAYYLWFLARFYRHNLGAAWTRRPHGGQAGQSPPIPEIASIMGRVAAEPEQLEDEELLSFGDSEPDEAETADAPERSVETDSVQALDQAMEAEVKTLIRVITESSEPKENFFLLFGLLTEKYASVADSKLRNRINRQLLEHAGNFAFELTGEELNEQWYQPIIN